MKRVDNKSSKTSGIMIAALVAAVVLVVGFLFFNPFAGGKHLLQLKRQVELVQQSKQLNTNQVKKKKIT